MKTLTTIILLTACLLFVSCQQDQPKVGEIWVYQYGEDNPFEDNPTKKEYKVLAIQKGYIKYQNIKTGAVFSNTIKWFLIDSEKKEGE